MWCEEKERINETGELLHTLLGLHNHYLWRKGFSPREKGDSLHPEPQKFVCFFQLGCGLLFLIFIYLFYPFFRAAFCTNVLKILWKFGSTSGHCRHLLFLILVLGTLNNALEAHDIDHLARTSSSTTIIWGDFRS